MNGVLPFITSILITVLAYIYKEGHEGFASTFLFYIVLIFTAYLALLLVTMLSKLEVERIITKKRLYAEQSQMINIRIKRFFPIPFVWYAVQEQWPEKLTGTPDRILFPGFKRRMDIAIELPHLARGNYELKEITIRSGDVFGLLKKAKNFSLSDRFLVLPRYDQLKKWAVKDGQKNGQARISRHLAEELSSIAGVREYQYGDRLSRIDWKAFARNANLKTKEFEQQTSNQYAILLDTRPHLYGNANEFEKAVRLAASFVHWGYQRKMKFSLWYDQDGRVKGAEGNHSHDYYKMMEDLAYVQLQGETSYLHFIQQMLTRLPQGTHLVLITPKVDQALAKLIVELSLKKWKVEVCLVSNQPSQEEHQWLTKIQGSGVNCYRELA